MFDWLHRMMPRGIYGRALLILIVPIVTIQIVVSMVFIQRHYEAVTRQMTRNLAIEVAHIVRAAEAAASGPEAAAAAAAQGRSLQIDVTLPGRVVSGDSYLFYDLQGRTVAATLRERVEALQGLDLSTWSRVELSAPTRWGTINLSFDRRRVTATNPHQLLVVMLATGILMTVIATVFLRNQVRPIRQLAVAADAFGKGRSVPFRPSGATEVRAAGAAFLEMRARIERHIEQRTLMLSGVSHDLRTPLTRLKLSLSLLEESDEVRAMQKDVAEMERLLDAFLDFARADATESEAETVDPVAVAQEVVADAGRTGAPVTFAGAEGSGPARLRTAAVKRALANLVGNAVRYGRTAQVSVKVGPSTVCFAVEDDGPGIPKEKREEAMRPFTRLDRSRNQDRGSGVGLGLSIAADIARSHGGSLRLGESERLGGLRAELIVAR